MIMILMLTLSLFFISCGTNEKISSNSNSVADTSQLWDDPGNIPVCFVQAHGRQQDVQDIVVRNFDRTQHVRFTGWGICDASTPSPAIRVALTPPVLLNIFSIVYGCSSIGPGPDEFPTCSNLSGISDSNMFIFERNIGIEPTLIHEFGHALGLRHEHARTDAPRNCQTREIAAEGGNIVYHSPNYDPDSTMTYCAENPNLSDLDIAGLDLLYP